MKDKEIEKFIEQVKVESTYRKIIKNDAIYQLINIFNADFTKQSYPNEIQNPLEIALQFYKEYNLQYYSMIIDGIENERIIISQDNGKSFTDTQSNTAYIRLYGKDGDLFIIVHELAHFIDRNSNPKIIPDEFWFLSETFAFYVEKKLELWLGKKEYKKLISVRTNNRMYFESKMLNAIEVQLYYEDLYRQKGMIEKSDIDIEKIKSITRYDVSSNVVNYLLQYPLANILSDYLISSHLIQNDELSEICMNVNLYEIIDNYLITKIKR